MPLPIASYVKAYERDETLRTFCDAWLRDARTSGPNIEHGAVLVRLAEVNPDAALMCAVSLVELAPEEVEDMALAGPLEFLLVKHGADYIDVIGELTRTVARLPRILSYIWGDHIPPAVMRKIELFRAA